MNNSSSNPMHQLADIATIGGGAAFNNTNNSNLGGNNNNVNNNMNNHSNLLSSFGLNHNGGVVAGLHHHNPHPAPTKKKNKTKQTFAQTLMNLLSVKECQSAIRWMPNGESFCIIDIKELVEKVLPKYFKEAKYTSFVSIYFIMQVPMDLVQYNSYSNLIFLFLHTIIAQTRKLNRWGFKQFTLPHRETNDIEPRVEMSIYTHDLFQRDNPSLCDQMDGGYRRRTSRKNSELQNSDLTLGDMLGAGRTPIINSAHTMNQLQEHDSNLLIQQMQQMQQLNFLIQQMQQQMVQSNQQQQQQGNSQHPPIMNTNTQLIDTTVPLAQPAQEGPVTNLNSMLMNNNNKAAPAAATDTSDWMKDIHDVVGTNRRSSMDLGFLGGPNRRATLESLASLGAAGGRRTSLGFMPYDPTTNRRGSGLSFGGLSNLSNEVGQGGSNHPIPQAVTVKVDMNGNNEADTVDQGPSSQGEEGKIGEGDNTAGGQDEIRNCQAKLAILEDMITKEREKLGVATKDNTTTDR